MHYLVLGLVLIVVFLCLKSLLTIMGQKYLDSFFEDPTGGVVPLDLIPPKSKTKSEKS